MYTEAIQDGCMWIAKFGLLIFTGGALLAQHTYTPGDIEEGGKLFRANCVLCHGPEGDLVPGVDLGHGKFRRASTEDGLIRIIQNGIPGTAMPPNNLQDFQAEIILAYLRSVATAGRSTSGNGNTARGKTLFEGKGECLSCHRVNGNGSRVGPDLSEIGALRRTVELEQSLVDPNAEVLPQNRYYRVVTRTGETITGRLLNADTFTLQILDSKERLVSLSRSNLRESGFVENSPMPPYKDKLSSQELADLIAYLISLKGL
jgi:putative heme-binding domain-containing protein